MRCDDCGQNVGGPGKWLPHGRLDGNVLDALPVFDDYRAHHPPCQRCGRWGTQWHHFLPRHVAADNELDPGEADLWPGAWLCPDCHQRWHRLVDNPRHQPVAAHAGGHSPDPDVSGGYGPDDPERPF